MWAQWPQLGTSIQPYLKNYNNKLGLSCSKLRANKRAGMHSQYIHFPGMDFAKNWNPTYGSLQNSNMEVGNFVNFVLNLDPPASFRKILGLISVFRSFWPPFYELGDFVKILDPPPTLGSDVILHLVGVFLDFRCRIRLVGAGLAYCRWYQSNSCKFLTYLKKITFF